MFTIVLLMSLLIGCIAAVISFVIERRKGEDETPDWWPTTKGGLMGFLIPFVIYMVFRFYAGQQITYWWFQQYGLTSVWRTQFSMQMTLWTIGMVAAFLFFTLNNVVVQLMFPHLNAPEQGKKTKGQAYSYRDSGANWDSWQYRVNLYTWISIAVRIIASLIFAGSLGKHFNDVLAYNHAVPFGMGDPIYGIDLSFYVFQLPLYGTILLWIFILILVSACGVAADYIFFDARYEDLSNSEEKRDQVIANAIRHASLFIAAMLLLWAIYVNQMKYRLLISGHAYVQSVTGAGYVDLHATTFGYSVLFTVLLLGAGVLLVNVILANRKWLPIGVCSVIFATWLFFLVIGPAYESGTQVSSQPNTVEAPYMADQIKMTRFAYDLEKIKDFGVVPYQASLSPDELRANDALLSQMRITDWTPLKDANQTTNSVQTFYAFPDVDVDRYANHGEVMPALRELDVAKLPAEVQGDWNAVHLNYTHGYGATVAAANATGPDGSPAFLVSAMPMTTGPADLLVAQPDIYFGEDTTTWAAVKTNVKEIGHPEGNSITQGAYNGPAGISVGSFWSRLMFGAAWDDYKIILSQNFNSDSRILFNRDIYSVSSVITPYLTGDQDPYSVLGGSEFMWMRDFYTVTDNMPYSVHSGWGNYIRGSVKETIGAYTGQFHAYVVDSNDPVLKTWRAIYPDVFTPLSQMPAALQEHMRYPDDLLRAQADVYARYHITDVPNFYKGQGIWQRAMETPSIDAAPAAADPRFVITMIPGGNKPEFVNTVYLTNLGKINLSAALYARSDPAVYGQIEVFEFPPDQSVAGFQTMEANIKQNTVLKQQLTQLNTQGSTLFWGNTIISPVFGQNGKMSLVYERSLYLHAENVAIPTISFVVVESGSNNIYYGPTLQDALTQMYASSIPVQAPTQPQGDEQSLIQQEKQHADAASACLAKGDLICFGQEWNALNQIINQLNKLKSPTGSLFFRAIFGSHDG